MIAPTADDVAHAIVAAARETGEDPLDCVGAVMGQRCRHYAMHALRRAFPEFPRDSAARVVGCPGKPLSFWNNSQTGVARLFTEEERERRKEFGLVDKPRVAKWWDEDAFNRVIAAIESSVGRRQQLVANQKPQLTGHAAAVVRADELIPSKLNALDVRRSPRPVHLCSDLTSEFMGDPPRERSALAARDEA